MHLWVERGPHQCPQRGWPACLTKVQRLSEHLPVQGLVGSERVGCVPWDRGFVEYSFLHVQVYKICHLPRVTCLGCLWSFWHSSAETHGAVQNGACDHQRGVL